MKSDELIKTIETDGWFLRRVVGSHHHYRHPTKTGLVTVPHPKIDLPIQTVKSMFKQAQIQF